MLDQDLQAQIKAYFEKLVYPIELIGHFDESKASGELRELLTTLATLSDKVTMVQGSDDAARKPSFTIRRVGSDQQVSFAAIPLGHEFTSLVLALLQVGGHPARISDELAQQVRDLDGDFAFETFMSLHCQSCPDTVQALNLMSVLNPRIRHIAIDGALFQDEVAQREIMSVPTVFLNGEHFGQGRMTVEELVGKLDKGAQSKAKDAINAKEPFEVLVIGGGPAGAAAAIYAARKGIRTGVVSERFGGQVLDTLSIENFISVEYTEGPRLAANLESHVRQYGVDIMNSQRVSHIEPAPIAGDFHTVELENGASIKARTIILSTGASWRTLNVPGENELRNKGVTFCPHCDGPLFKGKRIAVVGGGNSGIEAAIDLAGIVDHVTVLEFADTLRADEVLQRKLDSMPNTQVIRSAMTTQVLGSDKVNGLQYTDRTTDESRVLDVEGVFVQIGLLPNTHFLKDTIELSATGEIVIDSHGRTNVPGIFAAGDATTVPYKQIVIAMGAGSTAALSAFDYLIRTPLTGDVRTEKAA